MSPWWFLAPVVLGMAGIGHRTGRELATGGYRIAEDDAEHAPGRNWWPGLATGALAAVATWSVGDLAHGAALPAYLLFAWLTVALVWIDLDVHRLPVGLVAPTAAAEVLLLVVATAADGSARWQGALVGAAIFGVVYLVLGVLPGGGVGGGDIRLAPLIGALLGWLGVSHALVGLLAGFIAGGVAAMLLLLLGRVGLKTSIAYGPAMCLGAWVAITGTSRIVTSVVGG